MAKLTNKMNLPQQIVSAIMRDPYTRGGAHISVTQLIQPPRIIQLKRRHEHEIEEDASDRIWSLLGQTCHKILERSDQTGAFHEERISVEVEGWRVSGQSDCYIDHQINLETGKYDKIPPTIRDYKFTKVMAAGFDHPDWEQQLNILAFLWEDHGFPVAKLEIVTIYRDWSKVFYERGNYPPAAQVHPQKLWTFEERKLYLHARVALHKTAERLEERFLPQCTPEDQWRRPPKYAVMHPKRSKAVKLLDSQEAAERYIREETKEPGKHYVEFRPGTAVRCEMFCDVAPFCDQRKAELEREQKEAA